MTKPTTLPGIDPVHSVLSAMSAGLLPANAQINNFGAGGPSNTILSDLAAGDHSGGGPVPSDLRANTPASGLSFSSPVSYGGD